MEILDNISRLLGDDLKGMLQPGARLKVAASCFSIYAFEALKAEWSKVESLQFIFTSPTFVPGEVTDHARKERREFYIPKLERERSVYGTEFEIRLRNAPRAGESLLDHVTRYRTMQSMQRDARSLHARLLREPQFNRRVEINASLRSLSQQLDALRTP